MEQSTIAILIITAAVISFALEKIPLAMTAILAALAMGIFGIIKPGDVYANFGSLAAVMVASMMVVGNAAFENGLAQAVGKSLRKVGLGKNQRTLIFIFPRQGRSSTPSMNSNTSFSLIPRCFWPFRRLTDLPGGHGSIWRRPKTSGLSIPLTIPLFGIFAIVSASRRGLRRNRGSSATISCAQECSSVKIWSVLPLRRDRTAGCMTALS